MLSEILQELKKALENGDEKTAHRLERELNRLGMDTYTIKVLLKEV